MNADPLTQPFRRNLNVAPLIVPVSMDGTPTAVPAMSGGGVTSFKVVNPNPFWVWYRGWQGTAADMPMVRGLGHYIGPGVHDINRTQMPQWLAAVPDDEPNYPIYDANGGFLHAGKRLRLVFVYGSGS